MRCLKKLASVLFAATMCSFGFCNLAAAEESIQIEYTTPWEAVENGQMPTYDLFVNWLETIENRDDDYEGTAEELSKTMQWLIFLTRAGILPKDEAELEKDIEELLQECREDKKDCGDDQECLDFDCERIANLEDIPEYWKNLFLPKKAKHLSN